MKSQVLSRVLSPVFQEMLTSSSCPALSLHHLGTNFSREGTEVERQDGTGKKETTPPYRKGPGNTLLFDFLPFEWPLLLWPLSLADGVLVAQTLLFFQTQRPHHFRNHTSMWNSFPLKNLKPRSLNFLLPTPLIKCFWAYAPSIHTCIHSLYIFLIIWKCRMIIKYPWWKGGVKDEMKNNQKVKYNFSPYTPRDVSV